MHHSAIAFKNVRRRSLFGDMWEGDRFWDVGVRSLFGDVENRELVISISTS
ncbi:hypothetical protein [Dolichospermum circinale]|uniref:hypothetical protein n=1 Tax=Dolichospermum circinale TaxID=109265 RepID=UPI0004217105|nr:hypothetical protein [Dolichospermum circinale]MDB9474813.1 hypothetical protein [Dolichospermum circinale CS-537/11]MDB9478635.1 hypothetical protein [Dolichospermum circinale CS-537/03]MDB9483792.1 hypothetical protein [Dolichospermum circinale CS-537/05]